MWIKMRTDLFDDPAVVGISLSVGLDEFAVVGRLHKLWSWADGHTIDGNAAVTQGKREGNASSVTNALAISWIDRYLQCEGFAEAMQKVGWLVIDEAGIHFPKFDRHNGKTAKKRLETAIRVSKYKAAKRLADGTDGNVSGNAKVTQKKRKGNGKGNASSVTNALLPLLFSCIGISKSLREGMDSEETSQEGIEVPSCLDTPEFETVWREWEAHRLELDKPLTNRGVRMQLKQLAEMGLERATRAIEYTIARNWEGIREPDVNSVAAYRQKTLVEEHPF